jgi:hypothetical protein
MVIVDMWQKIKMTTLPGGKVTLSTPSTTVKKNAQQRARMFPTTVTTLAVQFVEEPKKRRRESTISQKPIGMELTVLCKSLVQWKR